MIAARLTYLAGRIGDALGVGDVLLIAGAGYGEPPIGVAPFGSRQSRLRGVATERHAHRSVLALPRPRSEGERARANANRGPRDRGSGRLRS
jgi:hypothetical protein